METTDAEAVLQGTGLGRFLADSCTVFKSKVAQVVVSDHQATTLQECEKLWAGFFRRLATSKSICDTLPASYWLKKGSMARLSLGQKTKPQLVHDINDGHVDFLSEIAKGGEMETQRFV